MEGKEKKITGAQGMEEWAEEVAGKLKAGDILLLYGDLGSGKTTFTKGLAWALGVKAEVTSPSFTIVSEYEAGGGRGIGKLVHVDLYRLSEGGAERDPSIQDLLGVSEAKPSTVVVIEWADYLKQEVPRSRKIYFSHGGGKEERVVGGDLV